MRVGRDRFPPLLVAGLFAVLGLVGLPACGDAGSYNDALGRAAPPGTEIGAAGAAVSPVAPLAPFSPPATTRPAGAFCQDVQQLQALFPALLAGPAAAPTAYARASATVNRLPADAPAEVRPAATAVRRAVARIELDVRSNPPDGRDLVLASLSLQRALQQVIQFAATHC